MTNIDIKNIAEKWQKKWDEAGVNKTDNQSDKPKFFALDMFPYPSGAGLHVGHPKGYLATDVISRKKQLEGFNVLHPMGFDSFGLPTEQYAMKHKIHPSEATKVNIERFKEQLKSMGFNYDWDREISTADPEFYKWTQWMFLQMYNHYFDLGVQKARPMKDLEETLNTYSKDEKITNEHQAEIKTFIKYIKKHNLSLTNSAENKRSEVISAYLDSRRLAYLAYAPVIWSPTLQTVLAQEDLDENGNDERTGNPVEMRNMRQWMVRITDYAERLLTGLDDLPEWQASVKEMQRNWIGKSEGTLMTMHIAKEIAQQDTLIKVQTRKGYEYITDKVAHHFYEQENEITEDGFVELVGAIIQNEKGEYLMMHNKIYDRYFSPGGKVRNDETHRHALQNKIKNKLGIDILVGDFIGSAKQIQGGKKSRINFYEAKISKGEPQLIDSKNFQGFERVSLEPSDNELGFNVKVQNTIIADPEQIHRTFVSLFLLKGVIERPNVNINRISNAPFNLPSFIDKDEEYVEYYCTERDEYYIVKKGETVAEESEDVFDIYTTRIDTVFGMSFVALAPEHPLVTKITTDTHRDSVEQYVKATSHKTSLQRMEQGKEKTGVFTGSYAINPFTKQKVEVWIADYVLMDYGTGAVMAVPAHDERDREFAKKYKLPIVQSIAPYFGVTTGKDAVKETMPMEHRHNMHIILKHHKKDEYLLMNWEKYQRKSLIIGGREAGETVQEAATREVQEETGYQNVKFIEKIDFETHSAFFAEHKGVNRYSVDHVIVMELIDDTCHEVNPEERSKHKPVRVKTDEVANFLNLENELYIWNLYHKGINAHGQKGVLINAGVYTGMKSDQAIKEMQHRLSSTKKGESQTNYRIQDWVFSRQRYWGEPFPIIHHPDGSIIAVDNKSLPVTLPDVAHYEPTGTEEGPLAAIDSWIKVKLPDGTEARRESNTMPGWAGSSWYWIRYMDPQNNSYPVDPKAEKYRNQVDIYVGGMEHATRHLIYARFWHKFLHDIRVVSTDEPFKKLQTVGLVMAEDGRKMSKRRGNVINPDDVIAEFGADAFRTYEMFMGPFDHEVNWSTAGVKGVKKFLDRFANLLNKVDKNYSDTHQVIALLHETIKKVTIDIDEFKFNTAISQLMIITNALTKEDKIGQDVLEKLIIVVAPFAPHLAEEMRSQLGHQEMVYQGSHWPIFDETQIVHQTISLPVQINGKVRGKIDTKPQTSEDDIMAMIRKDEKLQKYLPDPIKKVIYIQDKIVNIVG